MTLFDHLTSYIALSSSDTRAGLKFSAGALVVCVYLAAPSVRRNFGTKQVHHIIIIALVALLLPLHTLLPLYQDSAENPCTFSAPWWCLRDIMFWFLCITVLAMWMKSSLQFFTLNPTKMHLIAWMILMINLLDYLPWKPLFYWLMGS